MNLCKAGAKNKQKKTLELVKLSLPHPRARATPKHAPSTTTQQNVPNKSQRKAFLPLRAAGSGDLYDAAAGLVPPQLHQRLRVVNGTLHEVDGLRNAHVALQDPEAFVDDAKRGVLLPMHHDYVRQARNHGVAEIGRHAESLGSAVGLVGLVVCFRRLWGRLSQGKVGYLLSASGKLLLFGIERVSFSRA